MVIGIGGIFTVRVACQVRHTTVIISLCTVLGLTDLVRTSPEFGIACILAAIVMYDAVNVRHAVGEHGQAIRMMLPKVLKGKPAHMIIHQSNGHTPAEVFAGLRYRGNCTNTCLFCYLNYNK
jgi:acid phosphatase family membrane protein YuiD